MVFAGGCYDNPRLSNVDVMCFERSGVRSLLGNLFGSSASSSSSSSSSGTREMCAYARYLKCYLDSRKALRLKADVERRLASSQIDPKRLSHLSLVAGFLWERVKKVLEDRHQRVGAW